MPAGAYRDASVKRRQTPEFYVVRGRHNWLVRCRLFAGTAPFTIIAADTPAEAERQRARWQEVAAAERAAQQATAED